MRIKGILALITVVLVIGLLPWKTDAQTQDYSPVTDQRLLNPEPENWLMYRRTYDGWGYSPLDQINTQNVKKLVPVWTLSTGVNDGHEAPPIVNNGVMFITMPFNHVWAVDARTGDILWRYKKEYPEDLRMLHNTNRGVALYGDKVYVGTEDAHLVALDAKTGKVVWDVTVEDYKTRHYITGAPLAVKGKIITGISGGEFGVRGFLQAFDAETGKSVWKTFTVPGEGEPGNDTWPGDTWKRGGATTWITGHYDPETNLIYWGTGNAAQWFGDLRPGDNLYTTSVVALDADTGKIVAHHQYHWNDSWDWDEVSAPLLLDVERDGRTIKALAHPGRNGYLWLLERSKDKISFVDAKPYVKQNVFKSIDPQTGRPEYHEDRKPGIGKMAEFCPSLWGGKDYTPAAYSPQTKLLYIPTNDNHCHRMQGTEEEYVPGEWWTGVSIPELIENFIITEEGRQYIGELQAWDLSTMKQVWTQKFEKSANWGPVLTTAGGLVFMGGTSDRYFRAFDAKTGEVLWQFRTNSGITGVPVSYAIDGKQYIAVMSGYGVDAAAQQNLIAERIDAPSDIPQGGVVWVFAVME